MRTLIALLLACAVSGGATAQDNVLVARLPANVSPASVLELTRAAMLGRSWKVLASDAASITAQNANSQVRVYVAGEALRYADEREPAPPRLIAALRADLASALGQDVVAAPPTTPAQRPALAGSPFMTKPADVDDATMLRAVRLGLERRRFSILSVEDGVITAQLANRRISSTWKLYLVGNQLMLADTTVKLNRRGDETEPTETPGVWLGNVRLDIEGAMSQAKAEPRESAPPPRRAARDPQAPPASQAGSATERLRTLKQLFDSGAVTRDEYDRKRAEILRDL